MEPTLSRSKGDAGSHHIFLTVSAVTAFIAVVAFIMWMTSALVSSAEHYDDAVKRVGGRSLVSRSIVSHYMDCSERGLQLSANQQCKDETISWARLNLRVRSKLASRILFDLNDQLARAGYAAGAEYTLWDRTKILFQLAK